MYYLGGIHDGAIDVTADVNDGTITFLRFSVALFAPVFRMCQLCWDVCAGRTNKSSARPPQMCSVRVLFDMNAGNQMEILLATAIPFHNVKKLLSYVHSRENIRILNLQKVDIGKQLNTI